MKKYKLGDIVDFYVGNLLPRDYSNYGKIVPVYSPSTFDYDSYLTENSEESFKKVSSLKTIVSVRKDDLIISLVTQKAAIVREGNFLLPPNYAKLEVDTNLISKEYFLFWFNESEEAMKQIQQGKQGTTVNKLLPKTLSEMKMEIPESFEVLGEMYFCHLKLKEKFLKRQKLQLKLIKGLNQKLM